LTLTGNARMRHLEETGQVRLGDSTTQVNDMPKRWPAHAKTRPKAYEIPTWAIANAIRRRPDKAKAVVRHVAEPPLPQCEPEAEPAAIRALSSRRRPSTHGVLRVGYAVDPASVNDDAAARRRRSLDEHPPSGDSPAHRANYAARGGRR
jgi:hypothetical protein